MPLTFQRFTLTAPVCNLPIVGQTGSNQSFGENDPFENNREEIVKNFLSVTPEQLLGFLENEIKKGALYGQTQNDLLFYIQK